MNIIIIPSWFPSPKRKLNGIFFLEQAKILQKYGNNVTIIDVTHQSKREFFRISNFKKRENYDDGVKIISHTIPNIFKSPKTFFLYKLRLNKIINKILKDQTIDIIHSHSYLPSGYYATKIAQRLNIPSIVTEHASNLIKHVNIKHKRKLVYTLKNANRIICVGKGLLVSLHTHYGESINLSLIPNVVPSNFNFIPRLKKEKYTFLSIGLLEKRKRHDSLIEAFLILKSKITNIELKIVGNGSQYETLHRMIHELKLERDISLIKEISRSDLPSYIGKCDIFVMMSEAETFGVVYAEAICIGRPIIGPINGGAEHIITKSNGILVNDFSVENTADAMLRIIKEYDSYNLEHISSEAHKLYSEKAVYEQLVRVYHESK